MMKPGTTIEDIERADLEAIVNCIANRGVYYGLCSNDDELFFLRVCDSEIDDLCDFDLHEDSFRRGLCDRLSDNDKHEMRQDKRNQIEALRDAGRLMYRRECEGFGYLTLTPSEWQKLIAEQLTKADEYETALERIGGKDEAIRRGNQRLLTSKSGGKPISMWFEKKPTL